VTTNIATVVGDEVGKNVFVIFQKFNMIVQLSLERQTAEKIVEDMGLCVAIYPGLLSFGHIDHIFKSRGPLVPWCQYVRAGKKKSHAHGPRFTSIEITYVRPPESPAEQGDPCRKD
jgi:hypothetical protein